MASRAVFSKAMTRAMSNYGIETNYGLYRLSKDVMVKTKACPDILQQDIDMFIPDSYEHTFEKLNSLKNLYHSFISNGLTCYNSFYVYNGDFNRTLTVPSIDGNHNSLIESLNLDCFNKLQFHWNGQCHILKDMSVKGSFEDAEYIVSEFDGHHPILDSLQHNIVYDNYQQLMSVLETIDRYETLDILLHTKSIDEGSLQPKPHLNYPFIVVEGLDGTGKSTLVTNLSAYLNGRALATPPPPISPMRKKFDHLPEAYRRAYYAFSNYLAVQQVLEFTKTKPVVMDRFWHSTTAYAVANEVGCGTDNYIPPKGHSIYSWPKDLLYPSVVIFLFTAERARDSRVNERMELTEEEKQLSISEDFRARVMETYKRIGHTKWIEIDTSGTKEETLEKTIKSLQMSGICS